MVARPTKRNSSEHSHTQRGPQIVGAVAPLDGVNSITLFDSLWLLWSPCEIGSWIALTSSCIERVAASFKMRSWFFKLQSIYLTSTMQHRSFQLLQDQLMSHHLRRHQQPGVETSNFLCEVTFIEFWMTSESFGCEVFQIYGACGTSLDMRDA